MLLCTIDRDGRKTFFDGPFPGEGRAYPEENFYVSALPTARKTDPIILNVECDGGTAHYRGPVTVAYCVEDKPIGLRSTQVCDLTACYEDACFGDTVRLEMGYKNDPIFVPSAEELRAWICLAPVTTHGFWCWAREGSGNAKDKAKADCLTVKCGDGRDPRTVELERSIVARIGRSDLIHGSVPPTTSSGGVFAVIDLRLALGLGRALQQVRLKSDKFGLYYDLDPVGGGYGMLIQSGTTLRWRLVGPYLYSANLLLHAFDKDGKREYEDSSLRKYLLTEAYPQVLDLFQKGALA